MISCCIILQIWSVTEVREVSAIISAIGGAYCYLPLYFQKIDGAYCFLPTRISGTVKYFWPHIGSFVSHWYACSINIIKWKISMCRLLLFAIVRQYTSDVYHVMRFRPITLRDFLLVCVKWNYFKQNNWLSHLMYFYRPFKIASGDHYRRAQQIFAN